MTGSAAVSKDGREHSAEHHPSRLAALAPQRVSSKSSVLPWAIVSEDGVEDGEQFSGDCDQGHHFRLTGVEETLVEGLQDWVVPRGDESAQVGRGTDRGTATCNHAFTAPASGLAGVRGKPGQA